MGWGGLEIGREREEGEWERGGRSERGKAGLAGRTSERGGIGWVGGAKCLVFRVGQCIGQAWKH